MSDDARTPPLTLPAGALIRGLALIPGGLGLVYQSPGEAPRVVDVLAPALQPPREGHLILWHASCAA